MNIFKLKSHALTAVVTLAFGVVAGHAMTGSVVRDVAQPVATSVAPFDMMIAARNLPTQANDNLF